MAEAANTWRAAMVDLVQPIGPQQPEIRQDTHGSDWLPARLFPPALPPMSF